MFAMYFAAVTSLGEEQCAQLFQQDRFKLVAQYKSATEIALTQADLLNTREVSTLKAFVLYLVCYFHVSAVSNSALLVTMCAKK